MSRRRKQDDEDNTSVPPHIRFGPAIVWAPWRIGYITTESLSNGCFLCAKSAAQADRENFILTRGRLNFALLNIFPYNNGHLLIAPYRHVARLADLSEDESTELMSLTRKWETALGERLGADGFNIGLNIGKVAGAGLESHLHVHIVPRWSGDTNFMPVLSNTKVMPESLDATYERLSGAVSVDEHIGEST